jgi:hypothetical protein
MLINPSVERRLKSPAIKIIFLNIIVPSAYKNAP